MIVNIDVFLYRQTDTPFNNPLYSMSSRDTGPVENPPNQPTTMNDYCYIDKRPLVPIPMAEEDTVTYNTVADGHMRNTSFKQ